MDLNLNIQPSNGLNTPKFHNDFITTKNLINELCDHCDNLSETIQRNNQTEIFNSFNLFCLKLEKLITLISLQAQGIESTSITELYGHNLKNLLSIFRLLISNFRNDKIQESLLLIDAELKVNLKKWKIKMSTIENLY